MGSESHGYFSRNTNKKTPMKQVNIGQANSHSIASSHNFSIYLISIRNRTGLCIWF